MMSCLGGGGISMVFAMATLSYYKITNPFILAISVSIYFILIILGLVIGFGGD